MISGGGEWGVANGSVDAHVDAPCKNANEAVYSISVYVSFYRKGIVI